MAIAFVQHNSVQGTATAVSTIAAAYTGAQTAGNCNVVCVGYHTGQTISSVSDSKGNSYAVVAGPTGPPTGGNNIQAIYVATNILAATANSNTVTVNFSAAGTFPDIRIREYSGVSQGAPATAVDSNKAAVASTGSPTAGVSITTTGTNEMLVAALVCSANSTAYASPWVNSFHTSVTASLDADQPAATIASYAASTTVSPTNSTWVAHIIALKFAPPDTTAPTVPVIASVGNATTGTLTVSWGTSTDPDNANNTLTYTLQRTGTPAKTVTGIAGVTSGNVTYVDSGLNPNSAYTYTVQAFDPAGNASAASASSSPVSTLAAATPALVQAQGPGTPSGNTVTVSLPNQTAGNCNVIFAAWADGTNTISSVADNNIADVYSKLAGPTSIGAGGTPPPATTTTRYVSKTGSNSNNGLTPGTAWLTIQFAATNAPFGALINVGAGTYTESVTISRAASSGSPLYFLGSGSVLISGNLSLSGTWITVENFTVTPTNITTQNDAVSLDGSNNTVRSVIVQNWAIASATQSSCITFQSSSSHCTADQCQVQSEAECDAFHLWGDSNTISYCLINNLIWNNTSQNHVDGFQTWSKPTGASGQRSTNHLLIGNIMQGSAGQAANIECDNNGTVHDWTWANNIWFNVQGTFFLEIPNCRVYNNVFDNVGGTQAGAISIYNMTDTGGFLRNGTGFDIRNNVFQNNTAGNIGFHDTTTGTIDHNYFPASGTNQGTNAVVGGPTNFVNPTGNPPDYHIQAGSVLIGAGFNESAWFTIDRDKNTRTVPWDIGPYGFNLTAAASLSQSTWAAPNIAAGSHTVTVTWSGAPNAPDVRALEFSGVQTTTPLDVAVSNAGSGSTADTGLVATTNAADLLVAGCFTNVAASVGSGYTSALSTTHGLAEYKNVVGLGSYNATSAITGGSPTWVIQMLALQAAAASSTPNINLSGLPSGEAFGSAIISTQLPVTLSGIASAESFGAASVLAQNLISPVGIASAEAFGAMSLVTSRSVSLSGIASAEAFGAGTVVTTDIINLTGITSAEAFGASTFSVLFTVAPSGIASAESFGAMTVANSNVTPISLTGIASGESFGAATLSTSQGINLTGILSSEAFGGTVVNRGDSVVINLQGVPSAESFGAANVVTAGTPGGPAKMGRVL